MTEIKEKKLKIVDKRRVGRDENAAASEPNLMPTYIQQLEKKVERMEAALKDKVAELEEEAARSRERVRGDLEKRFEERFDNFLCEVLDLIESLDKAVEIAPADKKTGEGLSLVASGLARFLEKQGVSVLDPQGGQFDPNHMEALQTAAGEKNKVMQVCRKGYMKSGKVLKPAKVIVGAGNGQGG